MMPPTNIIKMSFHLAPGLYDTNVCENAYNVRIEYKKCTKCTHMKCSHGDSNLADDIPGSV